MEIKIKIHGKNMALLKTVNIETNVVPRIGETFHFEIPGMEDDVTYLIHDVIYYVGEHHLSPVVSCHEADPSAHRRIILEEHGWI